ncbi:hypothetical protein V8E36_001019 [Tilletia maclaganii]
MPAVPRSGSSASIPPTPASDGHSEFGFNHDTSQSEQPDDEEQRLTQIRKRRRRRDDPDYVPVAKDMPEGRKWFILSVIMLVQISMNFNAAAYASGVKLVSKEFEVSEQTARWGQATFLIFYAIGSLLWAPWSEELGRRWVLQLSLFLVNICQLPVALAPNFGSIIVGRTLGGLFSAGGSVTLGAMADLWEPDHQGPAVIAVIFASVLGASIAPIPCNAIAQAGSWRWCIWIQLILGVVTQAAHLAFVPETRSTILIGREVERRKEAGISVENIEVPERMEFTLKNIFAIWYRPFEMFVREPIVLFLSLLSGFSDALIFTAIEAFPLVYKQWGFSQIEIGAAYVPIILGYLVASALWFIPYFRFRRLLKEKKKVSPEFRLWFLLFTAPFLSIGLFGFAWTSWPRVHWIATMVFTFLIGLANYSIYVGCAATIYATPMYEKLGLQWASSSLGFVAVAVTIPVYIFYVYGHQIRLASPFAQELAKKEEDRGDEEEQQD